VTLSVRLYVWLYGRLHANCQKREAQAHWRGYVAGARDERSLVHNALLEKQLRQIIADSERPAA